MTRWLAILLVGCASKATIWPEPEPMRDAATDALTSPDASQVADAAAPKPGVSVDMATEDCNHTIVIGTTTYYYAEHAYPGKTKDDLVGVATRLHAAYDVLPGYDEVWTAQVRDGYAAVICDESGKDVTSVTFYLRTFP